MSPSATTFAVTLIATLAGLAGMVALWLAPGRLGGIVPTTFGLAVAAAIGAVALVPLFVVGLGFFGIVHLAYLGLVVSVPMVGVALGARALATDTVTAPWAAGAIVLVLPAAVGWYATHVEPYRLRVDQVTVAVAVDRTGDDTVRIGVLADLQTDNVTDHERAAVARLLAEQPDLILLPGDLFQGSPEQFADHEDEMRALLGQLRAPHGVYFVRGDTDHGDFADRALQGTDIVILDDETTDISIGDRRIRLGGNRLDYASTSALAVRRALEAPANVPGEPDDGTIRILVAHRPDAVVDLAPDSRVDLTVAGHTHGGQIVVPGFGPPLTLSGVPRQVGGGGLHDLDGNQIYVSTGVGLERDQAPQIRLFCPPSIGILTLH